MSLKVPDHFTISFGKEFKKVAQQCDSALRKCAMVETGCTGEAKTHNLYDKLDAVETTGERYRKVNLKDLDTFKRWITPRSFQGESGESKWDEELLAPTVLGGGKHVLAHSASYGRWQDQVFIDGLLGTNYTGKEGKTATSIPASNIIAVDYVAPGATAGDTNLTVDKIIHAKKILTKNYSYGDEARRSGVKLWGIMTSDMEENMLHLANASDGAAANRLFGRDFMPRPTLDENGNISSFLGINWIRSEMLPFDVNDATIQSASIFTSDALYFDVWQDITTDISIRKDLSNAVQFLSQYMFGAARSEDIKVVDILCKVA